MTRSDAIAQCLDLRRRGIEAGDSGYSLLVMAKSVALEAGLSSLVTDLMSDIGDFKDRTNRERKRRGLPLEPIHTFGGANMNSKELMRT